MKCFFGSTSALMFYCWTGLTGFYSASAGALGSFPELPLNAHAACQTFPKETFNYPNTSVQTAANRLFTDYQHNGYAISSPQPPLYWGQRLITYIAGTLECLRHYLQTQNTNCSQDKSPESGCRPEHHQLTCHNKIQIYIHIISICTPSALSRVMITSGDDKDPWWFFIFTDIPEHYKELSEEDKQRLTRIGRQKFNLSPRAFFLVTWQARCSIMNFLHCINAATVFNDEEGEIYPLCRTNRRYYPYRSRRQSRQDNHDRSYRDRSPIR